MNSSDANLEELLIRLSAVILAVRALIDGLLLEHVLSANDLCQMRDVGLQLASDLQAHGNSFAQIGGAKIESTIRSFCEAVGVSPPGTEWH